MAVGTDPSVQRIAAGWPVRGLNPGCVETSRARPVGPRDPPSFLLGWYLAFPKGKRPGRDADCQPTSSTKVEIGLALYLHLHSVTAQTSWGDFTCYLRVLKKSVFCEFHNLHTYLYSSNYL